MATVAVLGTGLMGEPMARNLLAAGFDVRAWNRTREKAEPLAEEGAAVCATPAEAAEGADFLLTMLADGPATEEAAASGALTALRDDGVFLQMGTIGVAAAERLAGMAREGGVGFVDAPVLGTRMPAIKGELTVVASGPERLRGRCDPIFDAVGKKTLWVGEAGAGQRLKLVINTWVFTVVEGVVELVALAQALDVDPKLVFDTLEGGLMYAPYLHFKGEAILRGDFEPSFRLRLAAKDLSLIADAAQRAGVDPPALLRAIGDQFQRSIELGHGDEDMSATYYAAAAS